MPPELPEVAVLASDLTRIAAKGRLTAVRFNTTDKLADKIIPASVRRALRHMVGRPTTISSEGKLLLITSGAKRVAMHLGMTGQFRLAPIPAHYHKHQFMTLRWGQTDCCFLDFRRFARMRTTPATAGAALGGFASESGFFLTKPSDLATKLSLLPGVLSTPRITWLLRHGAQTGVGNYLANEALGRLHLSPFKPCRSESEALKLLKTCQILARQSFRAGGTSFGIGYFRLDGSEGTFSKQLAFYQRPGLKRTAFRNRSVYSKFARRAVPGDPR